MYLIIITLQSIVHNYLLLMCVALKCKLEIRCHLKAIPFSLLVFGRQTFKSKVFDKITDYCEGLPYNYKSEKLCTYTCFRQLTEFIV